MMNRTSNVLYLTILALAFAGCAEEPAEQAEEPISAAEPAVEAAAEQERGEALRIARLPEIQAHIAVDGEHAGEETA